MEYKKIQLKTGELQIKETNKLKKLVKYGSRINKKRGFLFVSKVLGKHIPTKPSTMLKTYQNLSKQIIKQFEKDLSIEQLYNKKTLVIGFAETATALGQGVYESLNLDKDKSFYIQSTRYLLKDKKTFFQFFEEHCHAPSHIFYKPENKKILSMINEIENIILIDDEVTTGNTANNMIQELKKILPNAKNFYLTTILNFQGQKKYKDFKSIYLYKGDFKFQWNENIEIESNKFKSISDKNIYLDDILKSKNNKARFGINKKEKINLNKYFNLKEIKNMKNKKVLILGTSEFMYIPYLFAKELEKKGINIKFQATTRSPANIDNALKSMINFKDNYFENIDNFLYNVIDKKYDYIYIIHETQKLPKEYNLKKILNNNLKKTIIKNIIYKGNK